MRWQTLTSLAYGATGLMYFNCKWHACHVPTDTSIDLFHGTFSTVDPIPPCMLCTAADPAGAIVNANGTLGPLAIRARHINTLLLAYAPYLLHATSTDVWLVPAGGATRPITSHHRRLLVLGVHSNMLGSVLVGSFRLQDGRMAALVHNQAWQEASRVSLTFSATTTTGEEAGGEAAAAGGGSHGELTGVRRVDPATGAEVAVSSASVSLAAGGAELYVSSPGKIEM